MGSNEFKNWVGPVRGQVWVAVLFRDIKSESSKFINEKRFIRGHFSWQEGYGAFSIGKTELDRIHTYIRNQEVHHLEESSISEIRRFLASYGHENPENYK